MTKLERIYRLLAQSLEESGRRIPREYRDHDAIIEENDEGDWTWSETDEKTTSEGE